MYDFEKLRLIPIASVLSFYKVPVRKRNNSELVCKCPLPSHQAEKHKNDNPTFCIGVEKNKWFCHSASCRAAGNHPKGGSVVDLICHLDSCDAKTAAKKLQELFAVGNGTSTPPSKPRNEPERNVPLTYKLGRLVHDHEFILRRGITAETAKVFGVGFYQSVKGRSLMEERVVFPLMENGELIGYCGRTIHEPSAENPKWKLPLGLRRTFLYGLERCKPEYPLMICESPWGVLWTYQHNIQAAALLGHSMTDEQEKLIEPYHFIRLALDNDEAGKEGTEKLAERLRAKHKVSISYLKG